MVLGAGVIATAVTTPVVIHALGSAKFGLWVALVAAVSFTGLLDFGFAQAVARFVAEHRARRAAEAMHAFIATMGAAYLAVSLLVMAATLVIGLAFPLVVHVPPGDEGTVLPAAVLVGMATTLGLWTGFLSSILHAHQQLPLANAGRTLYWLVFAVATIVAALAGLGVVGVAAAMAASAAVGCAAQTHAVRKVMPSIRWRRPRGPYLRQGLRYSVFMFLVSAGAMVVFETDTLVIAGFKGVAAVTAYAITLRLTRGLTAFLHKAADVLFPFYAGMRATGERQRIREHFLLTARLEAAGAAMVVLALAFAGRPLIAAWVGRANLASVAVFALALTLLAFEAIVHPAAVLAAATGGERRMAVANNIEAILNLGLSIVFVVRFGVAGVIAATVLAQALTNLWFLPGWAMRSLDISLPAYARATVGSAALPGFCGGVTGALITSVTGSDAGAFIAAAVSTGVFALVYLRAGAGAEERAWLRQMAARGVRAA